MAAIVEPNINSIYSGTIKSFGQANAYGFVTSDEIGGEFYFGLNSLPQEFHTRKKTPFNFPLSGKRCTFKLVDVDGKQQARDIQIQVGSGCKILGTIKSYKPTPGYGFVRSSFLPGKDLYFSKSDLPPSMQDQTRGLQGKLVQCLYSNDNQGRPQVRALSVESADNYLHGSEHLPAIGRKQETERMPVDTTSAGLFVPRYHGRVKSFNPVTSYGFIEHEEPHWKRDVYLHSSQMPPGVGVGTEVTFEVRRCKNGQPQASNLCAGYSGQVKSFGQEKGYGFIASEDLYNEFGQDVYISKDEFMRSGCHVLDEVFFQITRSKKGEPQAKNVQILKHGPLAQKDSEDQALSEASTEDTQHDLPASCPVLPCDSNGAQMVSTHPVIMMWVPVLTS